MKNARRILMVAALVLLALAAFGPAAAQTNRQVYAFYFGWWTGESWNDGRLLDRPAAPYDSRDAGALGRHIDEAKSAGIDAFIMSWFGPKDNNLTQQVLGALLDQAGARGFKVGVAVDMFEAGYNNSVEEVTNTLSYLINDRANHGAYLRYDGKPVIYFWNQGRFSVAQWRDIRNQVDPNRGTIWVMEGTNTGYLGVFDGLYLFNTAWAGNPASTASSWMARTQQAGGWFYTPTVLPGWDESRMEGRSNPTAPRDRAGGQFLTNSWNGAAASGANVILVVSWNEYFENSHIEPSQNYGTQSLDTLRPLIAAWKSGSGAVMTGPGGGAPAASDGPTTTVLSPTVGALNVRAGAGTSFERLGQIRAGERYAVTGEANGWYSFDFNGQTGWVSGGFVTVTQGQATGGAPAGDAPAVNTGVTYTLAYNVRLRDNPGQAAISLASVPFNTVLPVLGRSADAGWLRVNYNGQEGWVAFGYGQLSTDVNALAVVG